MPMSSYLRRRTLRHLLGYDTFTPPDAIYIQPFSGDPTPEGTGPAVAVARQEATFADPAANTAALTSPLAFPDSPAVTFTHAAQFDAPTGGNMLLFGELEEPVTVAAGTTATIAAGEMTAFFT